MFYARQSLRKGVILTRYKVICELDFFKELLAHTEIFTHL